MSPLMEKKGTAHRPLLVIHPPTGGKSPALVGNYVLMGYGEGAVMAVPAHDERDFAFAKKYGLAIRQVIAADGENLQPRRLAGGGTATRARANCVNSGKYDGLSYEAAVDAIAADLASGPRREEGAVPPARLGHLAPALLGLPGADHPLPDLRRRAGTRRPAAGRASGERRDHRRRLATGEDARVLRLQLPEVRWQGEARDRHDGHLRRVVLVLPALCLPGQRSGHGRQAPRLLVQGGIDQYIGGIEHAILHLLYSRFWTKLMRDVGLFRASNSTNRSPTC